MTSFIQHLAVVNGIPDQWISLAVSFLGVFRVPNDQVDVKLGIHPVENVQGFAKTASREGQQDEQVHVGILTRIAVCVRAEEDYFFRLEFSGNHFRKRLNVFRFDHGVPSGAKADIFLWKFNRKSTIGEQKKVLERKRDRSKAPVKAGME